MAYLFIWETMEIKSGLSTPTLSKYFMTKSPSVLNPRMFSHKRKMIKHSNLQSMRLITKVERRQEKKQKGLSDATVLSFGSGGIDLEKWCVEGENMH